MDPESTERIFHSVIFFGNRDCIAQADLLRKRLDFALTLIGGLQQPGHPESEEAARAERESYEQGCNHVRTIALDIIAAPGFDADKANLADKTP